MQNLMKFFSAALLLIVFQVVNAPAQQSAQDRAAGLHTQLAEVQTQQGNLRMRLTQLEEALKPENIANSLAGVGSTHPEELREQRKRQLEKEKAGVSAQLEQLAVSQRRLETAIAQADAAAYQQSALPVVSAANTKGPNAATVESSSNRTKRTTRHRPRRVKAKRSLPRS
jgi:hypothetical protein